MPARTPEQIFQHHAEALGAEDIDGIAADYSDDAFFMTPVELQRGKAVDPARIYEAALGHTPGQMEP
jgi:ketosteroid isomerase-like protein